MAEAGIAYTYRSAEQQPSHDCLFPAVAAFLGNLPSGSTVLDLGCGNGSFLARFLSRGWTLHGTDFSPTGIEFARQNFPGIHFFLEDATASGAGQQVEPVDAIICAEVIEHVYDPRGLLRNAYSMLKPGGFLVITTPYHGYLKNLALAATGRLDNHFTALWDHGHIKFWSRKTLTQVVTEAGFTKIEFRGCGRVPYLWKSMVIKAMRPQ